MTIKNTFVNLIKFFFIAISVQFSPDVQAEELPARVWKLKNGATTKAVGLSVNFAGVLAKAPNGSKQAFIPHKNFDPEEVKYAVDNLPIAMGDTENFRLVAKTLNSTRDNYKVVTGYAITLPSSTSGSGNVTSNSSVRVREITENESDTSKLVELRMSSICDGVAVWIDFFVIGKEKKILVRKNGIHYFKEIGDVVLFDFPPVTDYLAWGFVYRSIESGEILGSQASIQPLKDFLEMTVKKDTVAVKQNPDQMRKLLQKALIK